MLYKRDETFRYEFNPPLACSFTIVEIDKVKVSAGNADGKILDISPGGLKLASDLDIPLEKKEVKVMVNIKINQETIFATGVLIWRKKPIPSGFQYGIKFVNISVLPDVIIEELKIFAKQDRG